MKRVLDSSNYNNHSTNSILGGNIFFNRKLIRLYKWLRHTNRISSQFNEFTIIGFNQRNAYRNVKTKWHSICAFMIDCFVGMFAAKKVAHFCPQKLCFPIYYNFFGNKKLKKFWFFFFFFLVHECAKKLIDITDCGQVENSPSTKHKQKIISSTIKTSEEKDMRKCSYTAFKHDCDRFDVPPIYKSELYAMPFFGFHSNLLWGKLWLKTRFFIICFVVRWSIRCKTQPKEKEKHLNLLYVERRTWQTN